MRPFLTVHISSVLQAPLIQQETHITVVQEAIQNAQTSRISQATLRSKLPGKTLSRRYRTILFQLRSGNYITLNDYRFIGLNTDPLCRKCDCGDLHKISHLFIFTAHPKKLVFRDLWDRIVRAAWYLMSIPSFDYTPLLPSPAAEPPPTGSVL